MRRHEIWDVEGHVDFLERSWGKPDRSGGRHWELLRAVSELVTGDSVLDAGCGMGHFYELLKNRKPDCKYLGFDNSEKMLQKAKEYFGDDLFVLGDIYNLSEFPVFESVICIDVLMHLPEIENPVKELWSKTGKELIISTRVDSKGFKSERPYSGETVLPEDKVLILRGDTLPYLFSVFGGLDDMGMLEVFYFDERTNFFRLSREVPRYGSFRNGWQRRAL